MFLNNIFNFIIRQFWLCIQHTIHTDDRSKFAKNSTHAGMVTQRKLSIRKGMTERQVKRRRRINHMIDAILNESHIKPIECPYQCGEFGHPDEIIKHKKNCPNQFVDCSFYLAGCHAQMMRKDVAKHNTACKEIHELFKRIDALESFLINIKTETFALWNRFHVMDRMFLKFTKWMAATAVS
ncbi:uncharacterized protein LOC130629679 [Hydractinia symbiolongicarpus]|uniref:uncharacterized protein LOC130629679 n=1 Tax=Hydractinia symbiolongicarpus TaxID=13093 RepID=UPI00254AFC48|nr:uncharacterized protein LOC130629679 [Hydractinia symbiolongicarpus]